MLLYILTSGITVLTVGLRTSWIIRTVFCVELVMILLGALLGRRLPKAKKSLLLLSIPASISVILFVLALITPRLPAVILFLLAPLSEIFFLSSVAALLALMRRKTA